MNKMYLLLFLLILSSSLMAQDPFFSNYSAVPMELNPAFTGGFRGSNYRLGTKYRNQWGPALSNARGFKTYALTVDRKVCLPGNSFFGIGINAQHDEAGLFPLQRNAFLLSSALHRYLGTDPGTGMVTHLALGAELGLMHYRLNQGDFTFDDQFDNPTIPDEISGDLSTLLPTGGVGFFVVHAGKRRIDTGFRGGFSIRHLNRPSLQFLDEVVASAQQINWFMRGHLSAVINPNRGDYAIEGYATYMSQRPHSQFLVGTNFMKYFKDQKFLLSFGPALRFVRTVTGTNNLEAISLNLQADKDSYALGFNIDINTSSLTSVSEGFGAIEISYALRFGEETCDRVFCPLY